MDEFCYLYVNCTLIESREHLDENKRSTGKMFCQFAYKGGSMTVSLDTKQFYNLVDGKNYQMQALLMPVTYLQTFAGQSRNMSGFRIARVVSLTEI